MEKLKTVYSLTIGEQCFNEIYNCENYAELVDLDHQKIPREELLLKLTILTRFFRNSTTGNTCPSLCKIRRGLVSTHKIIAKLIGCLESPDHHVSFIAVKTLAHVIQMGDMYLNSEVLGQLKALYIDLIPLSPKALHVAELVQLVFQDNLDETHPVKSTSLQLKCQCLENESLFLPNSELAKSPQEIIKLNLEGCLTDLFILYIPFYHDMHVHLKKLGSLTLGIHAGDIDLFLRRSKEMHQILYDSRKLTFTEECCFIEFLKMVFQVMKSEKIGVPSKFEDQQDTKSKNSKRQISQPDNMAMNIKESNKEISKQVLLLLPHYLHVKNISTEITSTIYDVLSMAQASFDGRDWVVLNSAVEVLSVFSCCALENAPSKVFNGFGGTQILLPPSYSSSKLDPVVLRKLSLLLTKSTVLSLEALKITKDSTRIVTLVLDCMQSWLYQISSQLLSNSCSCCPSTQKSIIELFADQDDEMIDILYHLLLLHLALCSIDKDPDSIHLQHAINPHLLFLEFLGTTRHDHSILLDLLVSSETTFLVYLVKYLHLVLDDWQGFLQAANDFDRNIAQGHIVHKKTGSLSHSDQECSKEAGYPENVGLSSPICRLDLACESECSKGTGYDENVCLGSPICEQGLAHDGDSDVELDYGSDSPTIADGLAKIMFSYGSNDEDSEIELDCSQSGYEQEWSKHKALWNFGGSE
ncbi:predicted protein [Nematostella vectensis]|uniref:Protein Lines N-terminal domain-containing protein n=1 Tax=Nematostella vectensis TaxID=45351 RepID=A7S9U6_NEMVE|nr:predicted protein [Nematostella vectensis]|eukprot:XP_001631606.1 predicted protein [Nematostella vectensis]